MSNRPEILPTKEKGNKKQSIEAAITAKTGKKRLFFRFAGFCTVVVVLSCIYFGYPNPKWSVVRMRAYDFIVNEKLNSNSAHVLWGTPDHTCWERNICSDAVDSLTCIKQKVKRGRWYLVWRHSETGQCQYSGGPDTRPLFCFLSALLGTFFIIVMTIIIGDCMFGES